MAGRWHFQVGPERPLLVGSLNTKGDAGQPRRFRAQRGLAKRREPVIDAARVLGVDPGDQVPASIMRWSASSLMGSGNALSLRFALYRLRLGDRPQGPLVPLPQFDGLWLRGFGGFVMRPGVFSVTAIGLALTACAGRDHPQQLAVQPQDAYSNCDMINAEIQANNERAEALASEQNAKTAQNADAVVLILPPWISWISRVNAKGAATSDAAALQARQEYLANLAAQRCAASSPTGAPLQLYRAAPQPPSSK